MAIGPLILVVGFQQPFQIEFRDREIAICPRPAVIAESLLDSSFVEAEDVSIGEDGQIAVCTWTRMQPFLNRPCFSVVLADTDSDIPPGLVRSINGVGTGIQQPGAIAAAVTRMRD